jgi:hypothetical protein
MLEKLSKELCINDEQTERKNKKGHIFLNGNEINRPSIQQIVESISEHSRTLKKKNLSFPQTFREQPSDGEEKDSSDDEESSHRKEGKLSVPDKIVECTKYLVELEKAKGIAERLFCLISMNKEEKKSGGKGEKLESKVDDFLIFWKNQEPMLKKFVKYIRIYEQMEEEDLKVKEFNQNLTKHIDGLTDAIKKPNRCKPNTNL